MWKQLSMILDARPVTYEWWGEAETIGEEPVFRFDPAHTDGTRLFASVSMDETSGRLRYRAMVNSYADDQPFEWWCDTPWAMDFLLAALETKVAELTEGA